MQHQSHRATLVHTTKTTSGEYSSLPHHLSHPSSMCMETCDKRAYQVFMPFSPAVLHHLVPHILLLLVLASLQAVRGAQLNSKYLGCFKDNYTRTVPTLLAGDHPSMTVPLCAQMARKAGFKIFSLQMANFCFGGNSLPKATSLGPSNDCYAPCTGNSSDTCGGPLANTIYVTHMPDSGKLDAVFRLCVQPQL
jgi:hypothetical protein